MNIREIIKKIRKKGMEYLSGPQVVLMKVLSKKIIVTVTAKCNGMMA